MTRLRSCSKSASEVGTGSRTADSTAAHAPARGHTSASLCRAFSWGCRAGGAPRGPAQLSQGVPGWEQPCHAPHEGPSQRGAVVGSVMLGAAMQLVVHPRPLVQALQGEMWCGERRHHSPCHQDVPQTACWP